MKLGMGFLPDDRKAEGVIADLSIRENINLQFRQKEVCSDFCRGQSRKRLQTNISKKYRLRRLAWKYL